MNLSRCGSACSSVSNASASLRCRRKHRIKAAPTPSSVRAHSRSASTGLQADTNCAPGVRRAFARGGARVTLFEASRTLGGRARVVEKDGYRVDNGQHILIGAYTETLRLLRLVSHLRPAEILELYPETWPSRVYQHKRGESAESRKLFRDLARLRGQT